jgi:hypothetical protein
MEPEPYYSIRLWTGERLDGSPIQIVEFMRSLAHGFETKNLQEYVREVRAWTRMLYGIDLKVTGETAEELAESFVLAMLETGLAGP